MCFFIHRLNYIYTNGFRALLFLCFFKLTILYPTDAKDFKILPLSETNQTPAIENHIYHAASTTFGNAFSVNDFTWELKKKKSFRYGYDRKIHWFLIPVQNMDTIPRTYFLKMGNPNINQVYFAQWSVDDKVMRDEYPTGIDSIFYKRPFIHREFLYPFKLKAKEKAWIMVACKNHLSNMSVLLDVFNTQEWHQYLSKTQWFWRVYFGFILLAMFTAVVLFVFFKEMVYLSYAIYLFFFFMFQWAMEGFAYQYFWPESPAMAEYSKMIFIVSAYISCAWFILNVVSDEEHDFKWQKQISVVLSGVMTAMFLFTIAFNPPMAVKYVLVVVLNATYILLIITFVQAIISRSIKGFVPAQLLLLALMPLWIISILAMLKNFGIVPHIMLFIYLFPLCSVFEILVFFFALSKKFQIEKHEQELLKVRIKQYERIILNQASEPTPTAPKMAYTQSSMDWDEVESIYKIILEKTVQEKLYLDPELTLAKLAQILGIPLHEISQTINRKENRNFNEFINFFRVNDAKEKLQSSDYHFLSVEGIGAECGFATKTTFYNAFKKFTQMSPAEYRKLHVIK